MPQSLKDSLKGMSPKLGSLLDKLDSSFVFNFFDRMYPGRLTDKSSVRRLATFPDKEGKMRAVGVLDYYSQIALKPLHT